ncbi:MAG: aminotransferase class III-fold pyridoxal phosphate-dependent enzyme [Nanoarchaeota archaeon]
MEPLGPRSAEIIRRIEQRSAHNYHPYPFVVERAEGAWLYDPDGNRALDFLSAYSAILSHRHPKVVAAVKRELESGSDLVSRAVYSSRYADFVDAICQFTGYDQVMPKSDGGSVTDSALSGLFMHGHERGIAHPEIILTKEYFHGRGFLFQSNALFDDEQSHRKRPRSPGIIVADHNPAAVEAAITPHTVGIFMETHKGEGGPLFTDEKTFLGIRNVARKHGLLFGCDEIQTGLGRCGYPLAWQEFGMSARPDFVTLGKALGGGIIPVSAIAGTEEFMRIFTPGSDGSTFGGYPIACAAAVASLAAIEEENIPAKSRWLGGYVAKKLRMHGFSVDHRGLLVRLEIPGSVSARQQCEEMLLGQDRDPRVFMKHGHHDAKRGVAFARIAPPPGAITEELIDLAVDRTIAPVLDGRHA